MTKTVPLTHDEAQRTLYLLRFIQMNLDMIGNNTATRQVAEHLQSNEFAGEINELVTGLEGSIFEADIIHSASESMPLQALEEFKEIFTSKWFGGGGPEKFKQLQADIETLVMLSQLTEREKIGPDPSLN